jgi:transcriptional regulator with XRE-family HTH domain
MSGTVTGRPERTIVRHGMASCHRYGCERPECIEAHYQAGKRSRLNRQRGIRATVPAGSVRAHAERLIRAGMPLRDIAAQAGVSESTVSTVVSGRAADVYRQTASALLAIPIPGPGYARRFDGLVDATGARRRLRALTALGYTLPVLAGQVGVTTETIGGIRQGRRRQLRVSANQAIIAAYDRLWKVDPVSVGASEVGAAKARAHAAKSGWVSPLAWDDEAIDDPNAVPQTEAEEELGDDFVDEAAVRRYLTDPGAQVTDAERLAAIVEVFRRGLGYVDVDSLHNLPKGTTQRWVDARRVKAKRDGADFPVFVRAGEARLLTKGEVVLMRERAAAGETQIQLSLAFDVAVSTVARVLRGERYAEHGGPLTKKSGTRATASSRLLFNRGQAEFAKAS